MTPALVLHYGVCRHKTQCPVVVLFPGIIEILVGIRLVTLLRFRSGPT